MTLQDMPYSLNQLGSELKQRSWRKLYVLTHNQPVLRLGVHHSFKQNLPHLINFYWIEKEEDWQSLIKDIQQKQWFTTQCCTIVNSWISCPSERLERILHSLAPYSAEEKIIVLDFTLSKQMPAPPKGWSNYPDLAWIELPGYFSAPQALEWFKQQLKQPLAQASWTQIIEKKLNLTQYHQILMYLNSLESIEPSTPVDLPEWMWCNVQDQAPHLFKLVQSLVTGHSSEVYAALQHLDDIDNPIFLSGLLRKELLNVYALKTTPTEVAQPQWWKNQRQDAADHWPVSSIQEWMKRLHHLDVAHKTGTQPLHFIVTQLALLCADMAHQRLHAIRNTP